MKRLLISLLFVPAMANAALVTGNELLSDIQSTETVKRVYGIGYIAGVADANHSITFCPPAGVNLGQLKDMTEQYLIANASIRNLAADVLIAAMLMDRWPCKEKPKGRSI